MSESTSLISQSSAAHSGADADAEVVDTAGQRDVARRLRSFILEVFYLADAETLTNESSLIGDGIVDSTGVLDVILFLESEFGISVGDDETTPDNFETIDRIAAYVEHKRQAGAA